MILLKKDAVIHYFFVQTLGDFCTDWGIFLYNMWGFCLLMCSKPFIYKGFVN